MIGAEVPVSPESRQRQEGRGRDRRTDLRRQEWEELSGSSRASREEAPEEMIFLSCDAAPGVPRNSGERSGTRERSSQEGPRNIGRLWPEFGWKDFGPEIQVQGFGSKDLGLKGRPDVERPANLRAAQSSRGQGSSQEGAVRWKATPELVSQDREAGCQTFRGAGPGRSNTGRSFARRSGGWQQCRPPFLFRATTMALRPGEFRRSLPPIAPHVSENRRINHRR